jgi:hypothetical protein
MRILLFMASTIEFPGEFLTRRAEARDRGRLAGLMSQRHPGYFAARQAWLYRANPHGAATTWLAFERASGRLAGCTSIFPRTLLIQGRVHPGAVAGDCLVDSAFAGRGVEALLARAAAGGLADAGVLYLFGPARSGANDSDAVVVGAFGSWLRPLVSDACSGPRFLRRLRLRFIEQRAGHAAAGYRMEPLNLDDEGCGQFFAAAAAQHRVLGQRDLPYIRWRYRDSVARSQRPFVVKRRGQIVGFVALETTAGRLHVVDLLTFREREVMDAALALVVNHGRRLACDSIVIGCTRKGALAGRLAHHGFAFSARGARRFEVQAAAAAALPQELRDPAAWHFLQGDEGSGTVAARLRKFPSHEPSGSAKMAS